jgi:hypothetical protein
MRMLFGLNLAERGDQWRVNKDYIKDGEIFWISWATISFSRKTPPMLKGIIL